MAKGQLRVRVVGDAGGLQKTLKGASGLVGKFALGVGAAAAAVGAATVKIGDSFNEARSTIRVGTGATGEDLEALQQVFRDVATDVPASFGDVSTAVADLNTRLGLTGEPLEQMSGQMLELSRITKTDLGSNIAGATRVLGDFGVEAADQPGKVDALFRAAQETGIGFDQLSEKMVQFGAPLRQMGFGFDESAALISKFEREGVNAEAVLGGMKIALGKMAQAGEEPIDTFGRLTEEIAAAGSTGEANAIAVEAFGTRAGPDLAAAIREGRFEVGDLLSTISGGSETIRGAGEDAMSLGDRWRETVNGVMVKLEPVATRVFDAVSGAVERLTPVFVALAQTAAEWIEGTVMPALARLGDWWSEHGPTVVAKAQEIAGVVRDVAVAAFQLLADFWADHGPTIVATVRTVGSVVGAVFSGVASAAQWVVKNWDALKPVIMTIGGLIVGMLIPHWISLGVKATVAAAKNVTAWAMQSTAGIRHGASILLSIGKVIGKWALLGAKSLFHAAKVAAAWLVAMGPIAIVIAAVVGLVALVVANWDKIKRFTVRLWRRISGAVSDAIGRVVGFVKGLPGRLLSGLQGLAGAVWRFIVRWHPVAILWRKVREVWPAVSGWVRGLPGRIVSGLQGLVGQVGSFIARNHPVAILLRKVREVWPDLWGFVRGLPDRIKRGLGDLGKLLWAAGRDLIGGLIRGITSKVRGAIDAVRNAVSSVVDGAKRMLGISSPSKVMMKQIGAPMAQGVTEGMINALLAEADKVAKAQLELVAPVQSERDVIAATAARAARARAMRSERPIEIRNVIELDGRVVWESVKRHAVLDQRRNVTTGIE